MRVCTAWRVLALMVAGFALLGLAEASWATDILVFGDGVSIEVYDAYFYFNDGLGRNVNPAGGVWARQDGGIRKKFMLDDIARIDITDIYFDQAKGEAFRTCRITAASGAVHHCSDVVIGYVHGTDADGNKFSFAPAALWEEKGLNHLAMIVKKGRTPVSAAPKRSGRMILRLVAEGVDIDVHEGYLFYNDGLGRNSNPPGGVWVEQEGAIRKKLMLDDIDRIDVHDIYFDRAKEKPFRSGRVTSVSGAVHECLDINIGYVNGKDAEGNKLSLALANLWNEKRLHSLTIFVERR